MGKVQHQLARSVLQLIRESNESKSLLTYQNVAVALGRTKDNARAIAQACDLLDAAAALANIPLLALIAVRGSSGEINPKAWIKGHPAGLRAAIINRSLSNSFTENDFEAIEASLNELGAYGNNAAWQEVRRRDPDVHKKLSEAIINTYEHINSINDLGADVPKKSVVSTTVFARDPYVRKAVEVVMEGGSISDEVLRRAYKAMSSKTKAD